MTVRALVPIKALDQAKSRLANELPPREREWLVLGMLAHVIDTIKRADLVDEIVLLGPASAPTFPDVRAMLHAGEGLNCDLTQAASHLGDTSLLLVIAADLPDLGAGDVEALYAAAVAQRIAIAPDHRGEGTNALGFRAPASIPFAFGNSSRARHVAAAGPAHVIVDRPGLAFDVDDRMGLYRLDADRRVELMRVGAVISASGEL